VLQETRVKVDAACELQVTAALDPTGIGGRWVNRESFGSEPAGESVDGVMLWETHGALSQCGAAYKSWFDANEEVQRAFESTDELAPLRTKYRLKARPGSEYRLRQMASLVPSQFNREPHREATRRLTAG